MRRARRTGPSAYGERGSGTIRMCGLVDGVLAVAGGTGALLYSCAFVPASIKHSWTLHSSKAYTPPAFYLTSCAFAGKPILPLTDDDRASTAAGASVLAVGLPAHWLLYILPGQLRSNNRCHKSRCQGCLLLGVPPVLCLQAPLQGLCAGLRVRCQATQA